MGQNITPILKLMSDEVNPGEDEPELKDEKGKRKKKKKARKKKEEGGGRKVEQGEERELSEGEKETVRLVGELEGWTVVEEKRGECRVDEAKIREWADRVEQMQLQRGRR